MDGSTTCDVVVVSGGDNNVDVLLRYLDSDDADRMIMTTAAAAAAQQQQHPPRSTAIVPEGIRDILKTDPYFERLGDAVLNPSSLPLSTSSYSTLGNVDGDEEKENVWIRRSYRAATLLSSDARKAAEMRRRGVKPDDAYEAGALLMGQERAGLLTKRLFDAYGGGDDGDDNGGRRRRSSSSRNGAYVPHVGHLLRALLEGYPNAVVSAASAGGDAGSHLGRMLKRPPLMTSGATATTTSTTSPLPVLASLVSTGCTGRTVRVDGDRPARPDPMAALGLGPTVSTEDARPVVTKGHRRKFVRSLGEWGLLDRMVDELTAPYLSRSSASRSSLSGVGVGVGVGKRDEATASSSPYAVARRSEADDAAAADHAEDVCDALLSVVDSVGYPAPPPPGSNPADFFDADGESVGEEVLLSPLLLPHRSAARSLPNGSARQGGDGHDDDNDAVRRLASAAAKGDAASARALLGLFELATGRSKARSAPPALDASDDGDVEAKSPLDGGGRRLSNGKWKKGGGNGSGGRAEEKKDGGGGSEDDPRRDNRLRRMGVTSAMHSRIVSCLDLVVRAMDLGGCCAADGSGGNGADADEGAGGAVRHPGRCIVERPFTTRRLNVVTLLADVVSMEEVGGGASAAGDAAGVVVGGGVGGSIGVGAASDGGSRKKKGGGAAAAAVGGDSPVVVVDAKYAAASRAMDRLMELPLPPPPPPANKPPASEAGGCSVVAGAGGDVSVVHNPWPSLVEALFAYPENNMYQVQFYRLFLSPLLANHEPTLKVLVQKSKFVGRAIGVCRRERPGAASHRGVLMQCLGAMRLRAESLPPKSWLRHYLESHDGWKAFREDLVRMASEQYRPGGGIPPPPKNLPGGPTATTCPPEMQDSDAQQDSTEPASTSIGEVDVGLGSAYAADLGFDSSVRPYVAEDKAPAAGGGGGGGGEEDTDHNVGSDTTNVNAKKKKSKGKKKKKK